MLSYAIIISSPLLYTHVRYKNSLIRLLELISLWKLLREPIINVVRGGYFAFTTLGYRHNRG